MDKFHKHTAKTFLGLKRLIPYALKTDAGADVFIRQLPTERVERRSLAILPPPVDREILAAVYHRPYLPQLAADIYHVVFFRRTGTGYVEITSHCFSFASTITKPAIGVQQQNRIHSLFNFKKFYAFTCKSS
jgi:hypothetical protein